MELSKTVASAHVHCGLVSGAINNTIVRRKGDLAKSGAGALPLFAALRCRVVFLSVAMFHRIAHFFNRSLHPA